MSSSSVPSGPDPEAHFRTRIRSVLKRADDDLRYVIGELEKRNEPPAKRWKCARCGVVKHFAATVFRSAAGHCGACGGIEFAGV